MSKFINVSDRRIELQLGRIYKDLEDSYASIIAKQNAAGLLRSGGTVKMTMKLVVEESNRLRSLLIEQASWVIKKSIYVSSSVSQDLNGLNEKYHQAYIQNARDILGKVSILVGKPELLDKVYPEVAEPINQNIKETRIEIEALVLESRSTGIKGFAKYLFSIVSKLWGG